MNREGSAHETAGWALVTGASRGIGAELARALARRGWSLILTARSQADLDALARELEGEHGVATRVVPCDLADPEGPARLVDRLASGGLQVTLLANNAGFGAIGPFHELDRQRLLDMVQVNVTAVTELTRRLLPPMVERGEGWILNVASTAAFQPGPLMAVYYASKAYVLSFSEAIQEELRGTGVSVTAFCPGVTRSAFQEAAGMSPPPAGSWLLEADTRKVAEHGVRALFRSRAIALPGPLNRLHALVVRFVPRWLARRLARRFQERRV